MYGPNGQSPNSAYLPVVNSDLEEAVPPFGLMQALSVSETAGMLLVTRPDGTHADLLINSGAAIPKATLDGFNQGSGHRQFPTVVAYENDNDGGMAPQPNEEWGPRANSWYLHKGHRGFRILGGAFNGLVNVVPTTSQAPQRCQLVDTLSPCGRAEAVTMLWNETRQDWCDEGDHITVYDSTSIVKTDLDPGVWLWASFQPDSQRWEVLDVGDFGCCGGSGSGSGGEGSGSGTGGECVAMIGGIDPTKLPPVDPDGGVIYIPVVQDGCLRLLATRECTASGSGS